MKKIDIFNHVMPLKFFERIGDYKDIGKRMREVPMLYDLDERFRVMDKFDEYYQVRPAGMPPTGPPPDPNGSPQPPRSAHASSSRGYSFRETGCPGSAFSSSITLRSGSTAGTPYPQRGHQLDRDRPVQGDRHQQQEPGDGLVPER